MCNSRTKGRGGGLLREPGSAAGDDGGRDGQRRADEVVGVAVPVHHLVVLILEVDREALRGAATPSGRDPGLGSRSSEADVAPAGSPSAPTPATGEDLSY